MIRSLQNEFVLRLLLSRFTMSMKACQYVITKSTELDGFEFRTAQLLKDVRSVIFVITHPLNI